MIAKATANADVNAAPTPEEKGTVPGRSKIIIPIKPEIRAEIRGR